MTANDSGLFARARRFCLVGWPVACHTVGHAFRFSRSDTFRAFDLRQIELRFKSFPKGAKRESKAVNLDEVRQRRLIREDICGNIVGLVVIDYVTCVANNVKIFRAKNVCKIPRKNLKIKREKFRYLSLECNTVP